MASRLILIFLTATLVLQMSVPARAQGTQTEKVRELSGPRKHLATIIFAGLGGAILGLSTLSFYGRPQEKLNNIAIGFAVGVISGTAYVTYKAATRPQEFYSLVPQSERDLAMLSIQHRPEARLTPLSMTWEF